MNEGGDGEEVSIIDWGCSVGSMKEGGPFNSRFPIPPCFVFASLSRAGNVRSRILTRGEDVFARICEIGANVELARAERYSG